MLYEELVGSYMHRTWPSFVLIRSNQLNLERSPKKWPSVFSKIPLFAGCTCLALFLGIRRAIFFSLAGRLKLSTRPPILRYGSPHHSSSFLHFLDVGDLSRPAHDTSWTQSRYSQCTYPTSSTGPSRPPKAHGLHLWFEE